MNVHDGTLSDLLFDEDDEFLDALEEAVGKLSEIQEKEPLTPTEYTLIKKPAKVNSKKEVNTMSTNENIKEQTAPAEAAENNEDDDFDFAESFNRRGRLFTIDTEGMEGHKASEVFKEIGDAPLIMKAVFINKDTGYGESVSVVTNNSVIYFSKANLEAAHNIRDNQKAVDMINEKGAFFRITEFEAKKYKKKGYSFEFLKKSEIPAEFTGEEPCFTW